MPVCTHWFPLPQSPLNINTCNRLFFYSWHTFLLCLGKGTCNSQCQVSLVSAKAPSQCWILFSFLSAPWFTAHSVVLQSAPIVCLTALFLQPVACAAQVCFASSFHASRRFVHTSALGVCFEANLPCFMLQSRLGIHKRDETKLGVVLQVHT